MTTMRNQNLSAAESISLLQARGYTVVSISNDKVEVSYKDKVADYWPFRGTFLMRNSRDHRFGILNLIGEMEGKKIG